MNLQKVEYPYLSMSSEPVDSLTVGDVDWVSVSLRRVRHQKRAKGSGTLLGKHGESLHVQIMPTIILLGVLRACGSSIYRILESLKIVASCCLFPWLPR